MQIRFDLNHCWDTLDEAILFFQDITAKLEFLKGLPESPREIYVHVDGVDVSDQDLDKLEIVLELDAW